MPAEMNPSSQSMVAGEELVETEKSEGALEALAHRLASAHQVRPSESRERVLLQTLPAQKEALQEIYREFTQSGTGELALSYSAEWFLDNYYLIQRAQRIIEEDLPPDYYDELPQLEQPAALQGYPRVYALARALMNHEGCQLEMARVRRFVDAYQEVELLTMGELWALPLMLRFVLLQSIVQAAAHLTGAAISQRLLTGAMSLDYDIDDSSVVAASVPSLHRLAEQDWKAFFEAVSHVEAILSRDPAAVYRRMDFETRDRYRKVVETVALEAGNAEADVARTALALAQEHSGAAGTSDGQTSWDGLSLPREAHVGYYLLDAGRQQLEQRLAHEPGGIRRFRRWLFDHPTLVYLGSIGVLSFFLMGAFLWYVASHSNSVWQWLIALLVLLIPLTSVAVSVVNWILTYLIEPRVLPKIDFSEGIADSCRTMVVIPAMLTSQEEVASLAQQLELHYLRNPDRNLRFALLTDFADADTEVTARDDELILAAVTAIDNLNNRHEAPVFYLFHRRRQWNPSEGVWMGWERKRGKLHEFNRLLRGDSETSYVVQEGDLDVLEEIKYVITLDADTVLPRESAHSLVGTLAHPLNRARFDPRTGEVVAGYTVLQPRTEVQPTSAAQSLFTRVFAGDMGLDLYTLAVSDVYQDLFGEGIYVGKGIYDVDAFERSLEGKIPENTLLSHDLFEGIQGRAGLVTDIVLYEDYPPNYLVHVQRSHRWVRGDWQLLPWLLPWSPGVDGRQPNRLSLIDRWKIVDNLRRSLNSPGLLFLFLLGWTILPGSPVLWTFLGLLAPAASLATGVVMALARGFGGALWGEAFRPLRNSAVRWLLFLAFLPYEALLITDAVLTTIWRLLVARRNLLQWTTAAHAARLFGDDLSADLTWRRMVSTMFMAMALALVVYVVAPESLPIALPLLFAWLLSPQIAYWISRAEKREPETLTAEERLELRRVARRTWFFFEHFVGPDDNWLPPDHFQEAPKGVVAHRTSPTNVGLYLVSVVAAFHFGYVGPLDLILRLRPTFETLQKLERYRGHFLNWIDTRSLASLPPRYVSTVDSGNLAASLLVLAQACSRVPQLNVLRWDRWCGLLDTLAVLDEVIAAADAGEDAGIAMLRAHVAKIREQVQSAEHDEARWIPIFLGIDKQGRAELDSLLLQVLESELPAVNAATLRSWRVHVESFHLQLSSMRRELEMLAPWVLAMHQRPSLLTEPSMTDELKPLWQEVEESLPLNPRLEELPTICRQAQAPLQQLCERLDGDAWKQQADPNEARQWCQRLLQQLDEACMAAESLLIGYGDLAQSADRYFSEMDFGFLFDRQRQVFHIGYNLESGQLDNNYYDLLASEARITSLLAIAKNDVPQSHWLHLARPITETEGGRLLLSWSGTMFEYLMPPLFMRRYQGTLLNESEYVAVRHQMAYGERHNVPWGISESGFYAFDSAMNYQYRAFGTPGLGFKRGLSEDLVIAPYASLLALGITPREVVANVKHLKGQGMLGRYGFYEALDFTQSRLQLGKRRAIVRSFMAHHQGMILVAALNYFRDNAIVEYFHADSRIQSAELLLQEQVPRQAPLEFPQEEESAALRATEPPIATHPWTVPLQSPVPSVHVLANGRYRVMLTNAGGGYSRWQNVALTRWRADAVQDDWGQWVYVQDEDSGALWSVGLQPGAGRSKVEAQGELLYHPHMAEYRRRDNNIVLRMEVTVPPGDDLEIRRIRITNDSDSTRRLRLTSYGEVVLTEQATDEQHPAFAKLFVESEYLAQDNALLFRRRPRSDKESPTFLAHTLLVSEGFQETQACESDRARFLGRGRTIHDPAALQGNGWLSGTTGATLDPVMSLGQQVELEPRSSVELALITAVAHTRSHVLELVRRYRSWSNIERGFEQARATAERNMRRLEVETPALEQAQRLLSLLIYGHHSYRADQSALASNTLGQPGLWGFSISGDYPILLLEVDDEADTALLQDVLRAHAYWRSLGVRVDLVILNRKESNYGQELQGAIHRLIRQVGSENWLNRRGGIFVLRSDQMQEESRILLYTAAGVVLAGDQGSLADQLADFYQQPTWLPGFTASATEPAPEIAPVARPQNLLFDNGYGGFSADGHEYLIYLEPGEVTPAPWINVIANQESGFLVSEAGGGYTWAANSGENRLTLWRNDPVGDMPSEALYLRDEETAEIWSPMPQPVPAEAPYLVRHGAGYSVFEHNSHGLRQKVRLFSAPDAPLKVVALTLENEGAQRRLTATLYIDWILGVGLNTKRYIIPQYAEDHHALLARNPYNTEFGSRVAFLAATRQPHGLTADRMEFLGRLNSERQPAGLTRIGLENRVEAGRDSCGVLQLHMDLPPNGSDTIYFLVGQGADYEQTIELLERYGDERDLEQAWEANRERWDALLGNVQVETPDEGVNLLLNRWLLYQTLSCRIWGRSALYQSSGAYGFRDQLQDVMALLHTCPDVAREHIIRAARHQFEEGDVLHWWHPPSGRGVRTRIRDDLLWLPFVTAHYVRTTGDTSILVEKAPFLRGEPLGQEEEERYGYYETTEEAHTIYEHCRRALRKGSTSGRRGLPLMGGGDWNDGMNRVGIEGRGESVWLAWFLKTALNDFAGVCTLIGEEAQADAYRQQAEALRQAVEKTSWDGHWYRRAYFDEGTPLGSASNRECRIDAIAQSWGVISGGADPERAQEAMDSVLEHLVRWDSRLILLFTPPFDRTHKDPGYIKGYLPGIRENGGQYTHAALWTIWAFAELGQNELATRLFRLINPVYRADTAEKAARYKVEPYVISADVYGVEPHTGRGGWTWYTGSSGWMYRLGVERILGLIPAADGLVIDPRIPPEWPGFRATYRLNGATYEIEVENGGTGKSVESLVVDGKSLEGNQVPLPEDGGRYRVQVRLK
ncbi:MAG TPA: glucoamylase family protein [Candidatus Sulfomarinibacteraceae bacterium]|nr:glucoamylase family protein [Candidatus Sulfomarinibacteraceae bacterium]